MVSKDYLSQNLARNYGAIARDCYGYQVSVVDLRNPTRSDGANMLHLVSKYAAQVKNVRANLHQNAKKNG